MHLPAIQTKNGAFCILELDRIPQLIQTLGLDQKDSNDPFIQEVVSEMMQVLSPQASGVVLSPTHSYNALATKANNTGPIFSLDEKKLEFDPLVPPQLVQNWGVEHTRNNYAVAKLQLYYQPGESSALAKKKLVAELHDYCQNQHIDFLLELLIYRERSAKAIDSNVADEAGQEDERDQLQLQSVIEFRALCDALILEFPSSSLSAATITAELDVPWLVATNTGLNGSALLYNQAKDTIRAALESGAQGFVAGEMLWADVFPTLTPTARQGTAGPPDVSQTIELSTLVRALETTVKDRCIELCRICNEMVEKIDSPQEQP